MKEKSTKRKHNIHMTVRHLTSKTILFPSTNKGKPHIDLFEPRTIDSREAIQYHEKREFGLKLQVASV